MCLWAELCVVLYCVLCMCVAGIYAFILCGRESILHDKKKGKMKIVEGKKRRSWRESFSFSSYHIHSIPSFYTNKPEPVQFSSLTYSEYVVVKATGMELVEGLLTLYIYRIYKSKYNWKKPIYMFFLTLASVPKISNERKTPAQIKN